MNAASREKLPQVHALAALVPSQPAPAPAHNDDPLAPFAYVGDAGDVNDATAVKPQLVSHSMNRR
jgi:hypothetical protein